MMAAGADPDWEVVTVRPADPDDKNNKFDVQGRHAVIESHPVEIMLMFAYNLQKSQIAGLPEWAKTERFNVDGVPNVDGQPDVQQFQGMVRKLLAERFGLKAHAFRQRRCSATMARQAWAASPPLSPRCVSARALACSIVFTVTMP